LAAILDPLRERLQDFQKEVKTAYDSETREVLSLKEQIRLVVETSSTIGTQADGLAKALRGDSQLRGRWGELALERILEAAGLTEGREYVSQGRGLGLRSDAGGIQKPDVVVKLPEGRTMIIDSKVPLIGYERLIAANEEAERQACGEQFVRDVKGHIDGLAGKRYQENEKLAAHDCVLMFVPIEGALAAALTKEPELFIYGWDRHVVLVGPSSMSLCDLNGVADKLQGALAAHHEAVKRLSTGRGNVLSMGERIRGLGVKTRRQVPAMLVDGITISSGAEEFAEEAQAAE
jgi:DNA recombination protein RmuC